MAIINKRTKENMKYLKTLIVMAALMLALATQAAPTNTVAATKSAPVVVQTVKTEKATPTESWVLTLNGAGMTTTKNSSQTAFGVDAGLGHTGHLVLPFEAGVRQSVNYASGPSSTIWGTKVYADWTLLSVTKAVNIFAGANGGLTYGNTPLNWSFAPEAGVKLWIKKDIAIVGRVEYPFSVNNNVVSENNVLKYFVGFQVKL